MFLKNIFSCNSLSLSSDQSETATALTQLPASLLGQQGKTEACENDLTTSTPAPETPGLAREKTEKPWFSLCSHEQKTHEVGHDVHCAL